VSAGVGRGRVLSRGGGSSSSQAPGEDPLHTPPARDADVIWHDLECGAYTADLRVWRGLAADGGGAILDLGCGTGRVALALGKAGHRVVALDRNPVLIAELGLRARDLPVVVEVGDAAGFELGERFGVIVAPMQLVQLLEGESDRGRCLRCVAEHLGPGGVFAAAIVDGVPMATEGEVWEPPLPDAREIEGWVYSSLPLETGVDGGRIVVRRLRQVVAPSGELSEAVDETVLHALSADRLEDEACVAGLRPAGRREIPATDAHVGSTVVLLEKAA